MALNLSELIVASLESRLPCASFLLLEPETLSPSMKCVCRSWRAAAAAALRSGEVWKSKMLHRIIAEHAPACAIVALLDQDPSLAENGRGRTPLYLASEFGHETLARSLLEHPTMGNTVNQLCDGNAKRSPLAVAAMNGHVTIMRMLIENGADVEGKYSEFSAALNKVCQSGCHDLLESLLDLNVFDSSLFHANRITYAKQCVRDGTVDMTRTLLNYKAGISDKQRARFGKDSLTVSSLAGNADVVRLLLAECFVSPQGHLIEPSNSADCFYKACALGHSAVVEALLSHHIDPNQSRLQPVNGAEHKELVNADSLELHVPLVAAAGNGHQTVLACLLENWANVNQQGCFRGVHTLTPLMAAVQVGDAKNVLALLAARADTSIKDRTGKRAVDYMASEDNSLSVLELS